MLNPTSKVMHFLFALAPLKAMKSEMRKYILKQIRNHMSEYPSDVHVFTSPTPVLHPFPPPPGGRDRVPCNPRRENMTSPPKFLIRVYSKSHSVPSSSIHHLQVAAASVPSSVPFHISSVEQCKSRYSRVARINQPGVEGERLHRNPLYYIIRNLRPSYEKRALMHHSSRPCSFPERKSVHERISIMPSSHG